MGTRKSTCACAGRLSVVTKAMTVSLPRVDAELTGRSSSESNAKSSAGSVASVDAPGAASRGGGDAPHAAHRAASRGASRALLVALLAHELIFSLGEENIEGRKRTVASRNVLLHLHFLVVSELRMAVDALFEHAKAITNHDDFVKERIDGDPPLLEAFLAGLEDDFSSFPLSGELDRAHPELVAEHLRQHFAKLFGVHFEQILRKYGWR